MRDDRPFEFGYHLPRYDRHGTASAWRELARAAEDAGFDAVWRDDHVTIPAELDLEGYQFGTPTWAHPTTPWCDVFVTLAHVAGATDDISVGSNVCVVPYRHPVLLAKQALSLVAVSGGRFEFGVGVGWLRAEFEALGVPFDERGSRTDEFLELFGRALREGVLAFDGPHHRVPRTGFHPIPVAAHRPRLWVGGDSPAAYRRVARYGDGWTVVGRDPDEIGRARERIGEAWSAAGRSGRPAVMVRRPVALGSAVDPPPDAVAGDAEAVIAAVGPYADAGVTHFAMASPADDLATERAQLERFGDEVLSAFD